MATETVTSSGYAAMPEPAATVVIPTYNRVTHLLETLRHLEAQTRADFDVLVVDDGSTDDTLAKLAAFVADTALALRVSTQSNAGPARARNVGIAQARAPVVIMIGDDTYPDPDFVSEHLAFHAAEPSESAMAVGWTRWCERSPVTPFMRWLEMDGVQFGYRGLLAGQRPNWQHFYTSNLSGKTRYLRAHPFNEQFPTAAWEDMELGLRLETYHDLSMTFLANAVTHHDHPVTLNAACKRMIGVGRARALMDEIWPAKAMRVNLSGVRGALARPPVRKALVAVTRLATALRCPNRLIRLTLELHHDLGYREALAGH